MVDGRGERLGEGKLVGGKGEVRSLERGSWLVGGERLVGGRGEVGRWEGGDVGGGGWLVGEDRGSSKCLTDILVPNSVL